MERGSLENLSFPPSFFVPEVREGFYVSEMMKRYHAAQLTVLSEIDRVCRKYNLPWYADNGTLLGTVRHGGYIPWDDDIDICMMRHDMDRLFDVAEKELPEGYQVLNIRRNGYEYLLAQITNGLSIGYAGERLRDAHSCPYIIGIDIFAMDGAFRDREKEERRCEGVSNAIVAAAMVKEGKINTTDCELLLQQIERQNNLRIDRKKHPRRQLLALAEELSAMCSSEDAENVVYMQLFSEDRSHLYPKALFSGRVRMPFENTYLPVPARYDKVLQIEYGDFMRVFKGGGMHEYPVYDNQEQLLREKTGCHTGRYTLHREHLSLPPRASTRKDRIRQLTAVMEKAQAQSEQLIAAGRQADAEQLLLSCAPLLNELDLLLSPKREIVFLPVKADWWNTMEPLYRAALTEENNSVTVIAVPYLEAEPDGSNPHPVDERDLFPKDLPLTAASGYDFGTRHPDMIVIQHPYDEWSMAVHLPEFFRSANLRQMTDRLVYLPCHDADTPADREGASAKALRVLIEQPAVVNADEVIVRDEGMRALYIDTLTKIAGDDTRPLWEEKIKERSLFSF
ncbi:MAG: LicD family protein [Lachnospiraceae bacterium]|nr:LicD family protein [Lachnospiraceae bacterium]